MTLGRLPDPTTAGAGLTAHPLIRRLIALGLEPADFVIFGGGPLLARGLRHYLRDLDVVARGAAWERAAALGVPAIGPLSGMPMVHFWGGRIEVSPGWISPEWDADSLIDQADVLCGLRFAKLAHVLAYKRDLNRPKDRVDIRLIESIGETASRRRPG